MYFVNNKMKGAWSLINVHSNVHIVNENQYIFNNIFLVREIELHRLPENILVLSTD